MALKLHECITCKVRNCSILKTCDKETLSAISSFKLSKSLPKGNKLFSEGDAVMGIYFIKSGHLKIELNGKQGRPLILQFVGKGTVLGHRTNNSHLYHSFSATAVSDVQYCYVPQHLFTGIIEKSTTLKQLIINQILNELELTQNKTIKLAHKSVREKVADALLVIADVYEYETTQQSFRISFCRQDIADFVGTTKEQVSTILKDFEKEHIIKCVARKFSYMNIPALREIAGHQSG